MKRIVLLLLLVTFCISNASALVYETPDSPSSMGTSRYADSILYVEQNTTDSFSHMYTDTGSTSLKAENLPSPVQDLFTSDDKIYFVLNNGDVFRTSTSAGIFNYTDPDDYADEFMKLASLGGDQRRDLIQDTEGVLYAPDGDCVKAIDPPAYTVSTVFDLDDYSYPGNIVSLAPHKDGMLIGMTYTKNHNPTAHLLFWDGDSTVTEVYSRSKFGTYDERYDQTSEMASIASDAAGNAYVYWRAYGHSGGSTLAFCEYNSTDGSFSTHSTHSPSAMAEDLIIDSSGVLYTSHPAIGTIETYATIGDTPGYTGEPLPPTSATIGWDAGTGSTYTAGDVASINYSITSIDTSKDYTIQVKTGSGEVKQTYNISSSSGSVTYSFPVDALPGSYFAGVYEQDTKLDGDHCYLENPNYNYNIGFSKEQYSPGEWVVINYEGLTPEMNLILANDDAFDDSDILQNWTKSGNGQVSYHISDDYAQDGINLILKLNDEILQQDYADIVSANDDVLYGIVYDAATGQRIQNAHVNVGGTVVITDSDGKYQYITTEGNYEVTVSKDGYLPESQWVVIQDLTSRDFYLTPETADTDVYGVVRDRNTNDPISDVVIYIDGSSYGETVFTSSSGYFSADGLTSGQEYDISATVEGYESYQSKFTATNNSTDLSFFMYSTSGGGDDPSGDDFSIDWENPDDAKSFAQEWTGITWFILVVLFVIAAMGVKK